MNEQLSRVNKIKGIITIKWITNLLNLWGTRKRALHFIYSPIKLNCRRSWKPPCFAAAVSGSLFEKLIYIILISPLICTSHTHVYLSRHIKRNVLIAYRHELLKWVEYCYFLCFYAFSFNVFYLENAYKQIRLK